MARRPIVIALALVLAAGASCREPERAPYSARLEGTVAMAGNAPFTKTVLRAADGNAYEVHPSEAGKLKALQGKSVRIEATVREGTLTTADGRHSRTVRVISGVKVLEE